MNKDASYDENRIELLRRIDAEREAIRKLYERSCEKSIDAANEENYQEAEKQMSISVAYSQCYNLFSKLWLDVWDNKKLYYWEEDQK